MIKPTSRKQLRESIDTIKSKGLGASLGVGKIPGLTAKQRKFAEGIVLEGLNASDAYRSAYDTSAKANTINVNAHKLTRSTKVANTIDALERAKEASALHSAESLKALVVSTLVDVATNSDRDAVRVAAVKTLGTVVGVDMFRETKRIETVKDSDEIKNQIMAQLKTMMLGNDDAQTVDATDLLAELAGSDNSESSDPTVSPPPEYSDGTPADHVHTIPLEQSQDLLEPTQSTEPTPMPLESAPTGGDIFLENSNSYQSITGNVTSKRMTTK